MGAGRGSEHEARATQRRMIWGRPAAVALIAGEKAISAVAALGGAALALVLHLRGSTDPLQFFFPGEVSEAPRDITMRWLVGHLPHLGPGLMLLIAIGLTFWAALLGAESVGVWCDYGWGEFLIIVETASFLPIELYDIARRPHATGFITLAVNLLILWYVGSLYRRRLRAREAGESLAHRAFSAHVLYGAKRRTVSRTEPRSREDPSGREEAAAAADKAGLETGQGQQAWQGREAGQGRGQGQGPEAGQQTEQGLEAGQQLAHGRGPGRARGRRRPGHWGVGEGKP